MNVYFGLLQSQLLYCISSWGMPGVFSIIGPWFYRNNLSDVWLRWDIVLIVGDILQLGILTFPCLHIYKTIVNFLKNQDNSLIKKEEIHIYITENGQQFRRVAHNTTLFQKCPIISGVKLFNRLPENLQYYLQQSPYLKIHCTCFCWTGHSIFWKNFMNINHNEF